MDQTITPAIAAATDENQVNQHFFNQLVSLASTHDVKTSADIYASNGMKLVSKGTRVSSHLYERMVAHKLFQPLEKTIEVADGTDSTKIFVEAQRIVDTNPAIRVFAGWKSKQRASFDVLKTLHLTEPLQTLLSVYTSKSPDALTHITQVALIALGLRNRISAIEAMPSTFAYASLFHDVGEIYIDPAVINKKGALLPAEWKQLSAHPVIGQTVLKKMGELSEETCDMVALHHERLDGFGYPFGKKTVSQNSQILAIAETISGLINKRVLPLRHAEIALKIVHGEYADEMISLIASARAEAGETEGEASQIVVRENLDEQMHALFKRLAYLLNAFEQTENAVQHLSRAAQKMYQSIYERYGAIQRAFSNTGLDCSIQGGNLLALESGDCPLVRFEAQQAVDEIQWRLRELARELSLRCVKLTERDAQPLLALSLALSHEI